MKTKRIGRIIVIVIICVLVIAIGALLGVANYLVGYTIGRSAGMPDYMVPVYNDSPDEETLRRRQAEEDLVEGFRSHGEIEKAEITSLDGLTLRGGSDPFRPRFPQMGHHGPRVSKPPHWNERDRRPLWATGL